MLGDQQKSHGRKMVCCVGAFVVMLGHMCMCVCVTVCVNVCVCVCVSVCVCSWD